MLCFATGRRTVGVRGCFKKSRTAWRSSFADRAVSENSDAKATIFVAPSKHGVGPTVLRPAGGEGCGTFSDCQTVSNRAPREIPAFSGRCAATEATTLPFCVVFESRAGYNSRVATTERKLLNFSTSGELRLKTRQKLFGLFRSILSKSEPLRCPGLSHPKGY